MKGEKSYLSYTFVEKYEVFSQIIRQIPTHDLDIVRYNELDN
ncbi:hypothetical protein PCCS19_39550 [Paenibacillus sp. CCS19]|nr:hypothetical protein PCCS19_39550 [Paenibacillus cellulosilyticus]